MGHKTAIIIGRFSPVHHGHVDLFEAALEEADHLVVYIGSARDHSSKNPWDFHQRATFIERSISVHRDRMSFRPAYDHPSDAIWARRLIETHKAFFDDPDPLLVGYHKDESSYYLDLFPWKFKEVSPDKVLSATDIRRAFFQEEPDFGLVEQYCHPYVVNALKEQYDAGFNEKFKERFK